MAAGSKQIKKKKHTHHSSIHHYPVVEGFNQNNSSINYQLHSNKNTSIPVHEKQK